MLLATSEKLPWYGVRTRSNHEKVASIALKERGFTEYLPVYRCRKRWSDRTVEAEKPLFPGYVFCRFDFSKRLPIVTTPGVVSVVGFGREPAPIEELEIEAVRAILNSALPAEPCPFVREGERICVTSGPLRGLEGILLRKKSSWRMVVSITMLQRSVSVEIDRDRIATI